MKLGPVVDDLQELAIGAIECDHILAINIQGSCKWERVNVTPLSAERERE